jgi:FkbM family methyltransferase
MYRVTETLRGAAANPRLTRLAGWTPMRLALRGGARLAETAFSLAYPRGYSMTLNGGLVRVDPAYILTRRLTDERLLEAALRMLNPGKTVIDVGGWIGIHAVRMAQVVGPRGHVYTLEPGPESAHLIRRHAALNLLSDRITVIEAACSDQPGEATFDDQPLSPENRLGGQAQHAIRVRVVTIDDLCAEHDINPALIKIDVEGAELNVLRGALETLRRVRPIVLCELHPRLWSHFNVDRAQIAAFAQSVGYDVRAIGHREGTTVEYAALIPSERGDLEVEV